jgi:hypothetical protein
MLDLMFVLGRYGYCESKVAEVVGHIDRAFEMNKVQRVHVALLGNH